MATDKKTGRQKPPFVLEWRNFDGQDGRTFKQSLADRIFLYLSETAGMYKSDDRSLANKGYQRLRALADAMGADENQKLWRSVDNRANAKKERPNARAAGADEREIEANFERLCREGHSPREARGILKSWGKWSQSTIYRRTAVKK